MDLVSQYTNMFGSFDIGSIITYGILGMAAFFIISGYFKYKMNIWTMKKAFREVLKEIEAEKNDQSNKEKDTK